MRLFFLLVLVHSFCFGQEATADFQMLDRKNELKVNFGGVLAGNPEISYERILSEHSGIGLSAAINFKKSYTENYFITPYYRHYFGKKENASGFFLEGFARFSEVENDVKEQDIVVRTDKYSNVGLGGALGAKWTERRFILEINGGIGRNLTNDERNKTHQVNWVGRGIFSGTFLMLVTLGYQL